MRTFKLTLTIRAECEADARELLDYTANETDIEILDIKEEYEGEDDE